MFFVRSETRVRRGASCCTHYVSLLSLLLFFYVRPSGKVKVSLCSCGAAFSLLSAAPPVARRSASIRWRAIMLSVSVVSLRSPP